MSKKYFKHSKDIFFRDDLISWKVWTNGQMISWGKIIPFKDGLRRLNDLNKKINGEKLERYRGRKSVLRSSKNKE